MFDFDQLWYYKSLPQARTWDQAGFLKQWYEALIRLGLKVKILHPNRDIPSDLKMVIAPGLQMVDDAVIQKFDAYTSGGGHLVLTCRTGLMNRHGHLWEGPTGKPILDLIGASIEAYDCLPEGRAGKCEIIDGGHHEWSVWGDLLHAADGTRILVKYDDQFYAGGTAGTQKRHGQGIVTYSGIYGSQGYTDALVEKLAKQAKLTTSVLPKRVCVVQRGPYHICLNYTDKTIEAPSKRGAKFIVGTHKVEPAGVAVWE
jgi:beta-galactosidase